MRDKDVDPLTTLVTNTNRAQSMKMVTALRGVIKGMKAEISSLEVQLETAEAASAHAADGLATPAEVDALVQAAEEAVEARAADVTAKMLTEYEERLANAEPIIFPAVAERIIAEVQEKLRIDRSTAIVSCMGAAIKAAKFGSDVTYEAKRTIINFELCPDRVWSL